MLDFELPEIAVDALAEVESDVQNFSLDFGILSLLEGLLDLLLVLLLDVLDYLAVLAD